MACSVSRTFQFFFFWMGGRFERVACIIRANVSIVNVKCSKGMGTIFLALKFKRHSICAIVNYGNICILHMCYSNYNEMRKKRCEWERTSEWENLREIEWERNKKKQVFMACNLELAVSTRPLAAITNSLILNSAFSHFVLCLIDVMCTLTVTRCRL